MMIVTLSNLELLLMVYCVREKTSDYSGVTDELAKRTYAESGDYYVKSFGLNVKESLKMIERK